MKKKSIAASEFDQKFDSNENIMDHLDLNKASRPGLEQRCVSVDFPDWIVKELDRVSKRLKIIELSGSV
jgi:hypothetical protein